MEGKPDLIIGNYTDGNLAASLMARKLGITQVTNLLLSPFQYFCGCKAVLFVICINSLG